jgi:hypothetical protein
MFSFAQRWSLLAGFAVSVLWCGAAAAEVPRELFNKTISIRWSEYLAGASVPGRLVKWRPARKTSPEGRR